MLGGIPLARWEESHLHAGRNPTYTLGGIPLARGPGAAELVLAQMWRSRRRCGDGTSPAAAQVCAVARTSWRN
jgi:hypothetical protein